MIVKNRYGELLEFSETDDGLVFSAPDYTRFVFNEDSIFFVDPPGGPFICVGDTFLDKIVSEISNHHEDNLVHIKFKEKEEA